MVTIMSNSTDIKKFKASLRGELIERGDPRYDEIRKLYNGMVDKRPLLIARCVNVADVISAVHFGRDQKLLIAIRGGGHNGPGLGSCDDGLVIDFSKMKGVHVDPETRTVRAEPGCTQGDMDHASHAFGLAVPAGIVSTTGIAGLTLGGGHGYLSRKYGLTIDNLLETDVVLADGRFVRANSSQHQDLFWALRGGGGNFGVVTSFVYRAHPVSLVYGGPIFWDVKHARRVMQWYREFLPQAPEELCSFFGLKTVPSTAPFPEEIWGRKICALISCFIGPREDAEVVMKPIFGELPSPLFKHVDTMPFPALQRLFDPLLPTGLQWYWKGDFVKELPDEAIDAHLEHAAKAPSELSLMHLYPIDKAVHRVSRNNTAWNCRNATWSMVIAGIDPNPHKAKEITKWAKEYWEAIHPFTIGGAYVNFMMEEGQERIQATYGENHARLSAVKKKYDPDNLFRVNQNIKPAP
jgi:hypothetical protein